MLEDVVSSTSGTEQLLRHCAPSLPLPQLPAGASRALSGEKGGEEGHCVLFNGDRTSGEQLSGCHHSDAPFSWPMDGHSSSTLCAPYHSCCCAGMKYPGPARTQAPFSAMGISCQLCATRASQCLVPKGVWKTVLSCLQLWWPLKNTSYLLPHAVFCLRHLSQTDLCNCWTVCISTFNNAVVGGLFNTSPI